MMGCMLCIHENAMNVKLDIVLDALLQKSAKVHVRKSIAQIVQEDVMFVKNGFAMNVVILMNVNIVMGFIVGVVAQKNHVVIATMMMIILFESNCI
jgi:hypothetical protein